MPLPTRQTTVLLVEDDVVLRTLYRHTLVSAGFSVIAVEDGIDALRRVESRVPHVIVLDLELPRLGGRDVQRELAARPETRAIPIVVVSGGDLRDLDPADFARILQKPVPPEAMLSAVEDCLTH